MRFGGVMLTLLLATMSFAQAGVQPDALTPFPSSPPPPPQSGALSGSLTGPGFAAGTFGIELAVPSGGGGAIGATVFLSGSSAIRVELAMIATFAPSFLSGVVLTLEGGFRKYLIHYERVHFFIEPGVRFGNPTSHFYFALLASVGVEVYLFERFSIGGHTGLAFEFQEVPGGTASAKLSTGSSGIFAAYYF